MRRMVLMMLLLMNVAQAQKKWDGGGGSSLWNDAMNWSPDGVPAVDEDVVLDNTWISGDYTIALPAGSLVTTVRSVRISPAGFSITLSLPAANTAIPGLSLTSTTESMILDPGAIFINASGAASGSPLQLAGKLRLNNGSRYIHRTPRGNAELIDKLVNEPGTEKGIFEFDVPGTAGYTVSLTGNTFGSLAFKASAAGGAKSYSGSGTSNLTIRGDLTIDAGAQLTSTLTSDITLGGNLFLYGKLNLHPVTTGTVGRSFVFGGKDVVFRGSGIFSMNAFFRNLVIAKNASLALETPCQLSFTPNTFICQGSLGFNGGYIAGTGSFLLTDDATITIRSADGISQTADLGDVRTAFRNFSQKAFYRFEGLSPQITGDGIPDTVAGFVLSNPSHLRSTKPFVITNSLELQVGKLLTDSMNYPTLFNVAIKSPVNAWGEQNFGWASGFIDGPLKLVTKDSTWRSLPLGAGSEFAPIRAKAPGTALQEIKLRYKTGPYPNALLLPSITRLNDRGYYISEAPETDSWQIGLSYIPADSPYSKTESMTIAQLQMVNAEWKWGLVSGTVSRLNSIEPGSGSTGYGWLQTDSSITNFQAFSIGYVASSVLSLELLEFTARNEGRYNTLRWTSDQDGKEALYMIERSEDGISFKPLHEIRAAPAKIRSHEWTDPDPITPYVYYRLVMKTGSSEIRSAAIKVFMRRQKPLLYPNPTNEWIRINFSDRSSITELELVNSYGIVLRKLFVKKNSFQIGVSDLKPGLYFIRLRNQEESITLSFTKY